MTDARQNPAAMKIDLTICLTKLFKYWSNHEDSAVWPKRTGKAWIA